jgi:hypothetical protein
MRRAESVVVAEAVLDRDVIVFIALVQVHVNLTSRFGRCLAPLVVGSMAEQADSVRVGRIAPGEFESVKLCLPFQIVDAFGSIFKGQAANEIEIQVRECRRCWIFVQIWRWLHGSWGGGGIGFRNFRT